MKLYLSSYRIPTPGDLVALVGKPPVETRVAIIPNAKDYELPQERGVKLDEMTNDLQKVGFIQPETVDLREFDEGEEIYGTLKNYDLIWVAGGNTFVLRSEMRRSGFDKIIKRLLEENKVYAGESAGAIVAGLTLQGFEVADDPELADQIIWEGLGLTDRIIAPHADSPDFVEYVNHMKKLYQGNDRVLYLNDNQVVVVDNGRQKLITS